MLEELLYMILRGIIIGVVVSAPMGPVGIFCIQRTLDKGRLSGFYTGVGAAVSDLIYCLLTGFGLSFIEGFINTYRPQIQFLGACVLIAFGIWLVRKRPSSQVCADNDEGQPSREADILKGFALTFSNPLILFLIIGLFAQFNFVIEDMKFYHYVLGFIGIISGAVGWWWTVTYFVDKLRGHFNGRTMKMINRCVGIIILIFAAVGIFDSVSAYAAPVVKPSSAISYHSRSLTADFRVADFAMKGWQAKFVDTLGNGFIVTVTPDAMRDAFGDNGGDMLRVEVRDLVSGDLLASALAKDGVDPYRGPNSWRVARKGDVWRVLAGNREYHDLLVFAFDMGVPHKPAVAAVSGGEISVSLLQLDVEPADFDLELCVNVSMLLDSIGKSDVGIPGIYTLFDHTYDDTYAVPGGDYQVALMPLDDGGFSMIYLSGARVLAGYWHSGMRKALLKPTPFSNVFDVEWVDAEGNVMRHDVQAEFFPLSSAITVSFPFQGCSLRFRKE